MRTNIVLNDDLVREATMLTGITTKRELVEVALRELIHSKKKKDLFDLAGQIHFADDYDYKSARELRNDSGSDDSSDDSSDNNPDDSSHNNSAQLENAVADKKANYDSD